MTPAWLVRAADVVGRMLVLAVGLWAVAALAAKMTLVVVTVFVGLLIAGVFAPVVRSANRRGMRDWLAPLAVVLGLLLVSLATVAGLGARIGEELPQLRDQLSGAAQDLSRTFGVDVSVPGVASGGGQAGGQDAGGQDGQQASGSQGPAQGQQQGQQQGGGAAGEAMAVAKAALETMIGFFLTLAFAFLFLKDGRQMWDWLLSKFSGSLRDDIDVAGRAAWGTVGSYVRGLTIVALFDAVGIGAGLLLLGVPLALTLAALQFVASYVPTIGAFVAGAVAVLIAYVHGGMVTAGLTLALIVVVQQLGNDVIEPWVMGHSLGLHPAVVLIAVTAGGALWGIAGALLFVPLAAATSAAGHELWVRHGSGGRPAG